MAKSARAAANSAAAESKRREAKAGAEDTDVNSNVTEATIVELVREALDHKGDIDKAVAERNSANGRLRGVYKRAKQLGLINGEIQWYVKNQHRDPLDVQREFAGIARVATVMDFPIGMQFTLFGDGESQAAKVDKKALAKQDSQAKALAKAKNDGYAVGAKGGNRDKNPHLEGSEKFDLWNFGFAEGQDTLKLKSPLLQEGGETTH